MTTPAARRFYKLATALDVEGGHGVALDDRRLRTPKGAVFIAPTRALAEAIASEWDAQGEHIIPSSMPLTQLAFAQLQFVYGPQQDRDHRPIEHVAHVGRQRPFFARGDKIRVPVSRSLLQCQRVGDRAELGHAAPW